MHIEIWSDVMCPFCYIGKRKFETALAQFKHKDQLLIEWKSFQLSPDMKTDTTINAYQSLAKHKGVSVDEAKNMTNYVTEIASKVGLKFNFDKAITANSFNAHRLGHYAKTFNKQNEVEEKLFSAYFVEGKNIDDVATLVTIGAAVGLDANAVQAMLVSDAYTNEVHQDIYEAQQIGVSGVPFFALNKKYAISGAQESSIILSTLEKAFDEWQKQHVSTPLKVVEGAVCKPNGECK
ncbi:MAG: DsbA family oxidoreductase [Bacteroidia bacterium]|nr:DsbA family oxidoreductase [Bacteroidia bacterium]